VRTTTYVVGKENLDSARAGRKAVVDEGLMTIRPANTLVVIAGLADDDWLVEIETIAVLD
jgi:enamine deaminase RidA (YjgF/YER057c/UK114 family)